MAHECPDCYYQCHCNGDIDDILLNDEEDIVACTHCDGKEDEDFDECQSCFMDTRDCTCGL